MQVAVRDGASLLEAHRRSLAHCVAGMLNRLNAVDTVVVELAQADASKGGNTMLAMHRVLRRADVTAAVVVLHRADGGRFSVRRVGTGASAELSTCMIGVGFNHPRVRDVEPRQAASLAPSPQRPNLRTSPESRP